MCEQHKSRVIEELKNTQSQLTKDLQEYNESLEKLTKKGTTELQNSLELQEKELTSKLKQQHQKRLKLIDSQLDENWGITESLLKAPIIKISLIVAVLGIIIGIISTITIRPYLIPSESNTIEVEKIMQLEKEVKELQATRTANKQLIQELQAWQVPQSQQREDQYGKYIRVESKKIYNEEGTQYKWVAIKEYK